MSGNPFMQQILQNVDEDAIRQMLESLDEEEIQRAINWISNEYVLPHLEDVRDRDDPDTAAVREYYAEKTDAEQDEIFHDAAAQVVTTLALCRERPKEGFESLKTLLRDPWTMEALLLIFENEQHVDDEYAEQMKDFVATHFKWAGAMTLPEMYDPQEVREVLQQFGIDPQGTIEG